MNLKISTILILLISISEFCIAQDSTRATAPNTGWETVTTRSSGVINENDVDPMNDPKVRAASEQAQRVIKIFDIPRAVRKKDKKAAIHGLGATGLFDLDKEVLRYQSENIEAVVGLKSEQLKGLELYAKMKASCGERPNCNVDLGAYARTTDEIFERKPHLKRALDAGIYFRVNAALN